MNICAFSGSMCRDEDVVLCLIPRRLRYYVNDTTSTEIYPLALPDALPISSRRRHTRLVRDWSSDVCRLLLERSGEHTSELQSLTNIVCRLLLEKKKKHRRQTYPTHRT